MGSDKQYVSRPSNCRWRWWQVRQDGRRGHSEGMTRLWKVWLRTSCATATTL